MRIELNGKCIETNCTTTFELRKKMASEQYMIIVNGFPMEQDAPLSENDSITLVKKGALPGYEELEAMMMARHTPKVHKKVKRGKVAVAGLGGLGSHIAVMLARTGVGKLLLVDFDVVEPSNLNRQNYSISHLGFLKTDALKQQIAEINPYVEVETKNIMVSEENAVDLFQNYDVICEAFDNPKAKAVLVNTLLAECPRVFIVSGSGMAGYESANLIRTVRKMRRLYLCGDFESEAVPGRGLMAPRVQVCAGHQANMALRLLLEEE